MHDIIPVRHASVTIICDNRNINSELECCNIFMSLQSASESAHGNQHCVEITAEFLIPHGNVFAVDMY